MSQYRVLTPPTDYVTTIPRPDEPPLPSFMTVQDGVPVIYSEDTVPTCGVRMVHASNPNAPSTRLGVSVLFVPPQAEMARHEHEAEETYIIAEGSGVMLFRDGGSRPVAKGDFIYLPSWAEHGIRNTGTGMLVVYLALTPQNP